MWILECEGPLFHDKKLWLRPGTSHLFGRNKQETLRNTESYVLDAKSVSKKHLKLSVSAVRAGTGSQLHTRSEVIIEDFSKLGTTIDGERISQTTKVLNKEKHVLKVAKYEHALILRWQPVVFTIVNLTRTEKSSADPLSNYRKQLEHIDIKFTKDYVSGQTTHVVAEKRNLPAVLQGLIHGQYIVTKDYLPEVVKAATEEPAADGESEPKAPLEKDFEASWPDPMPFVPPVANEPVKRDASYLAPKAERADIFYGFVFVFCTKTQFDQLGPVVNAGSGKAILYESFQEGKTKVEDFVTFVRNVAGEKGAGELSDSTQSRGVVVVRFTAKGEEWDTHFIKEMDLQLNQRSIEQKAFLDVILTVDTSDLRKRLAEELDLEATARPSASNSVRPTPAPRKEAPRTAPPKSEPPSQASRRLKTESRFKGFDAFDDSDSDEADPTSAAAPAAATRSMPQLQHDVSMDEATDLPASLPARSTRQAAVNPRKRQTPEPSREDYLDEILPAQAAMKRRKLNATQHTRAKTPESEKKNKPVRKAKKEVDVLAEVQKRREEEETRAREDAEALKEAMDGMEIHGPANLVEVGEMVLSRSHSADVSRTSHKSSERWDERWNDRQNFKRFRRKGEARPARTRQRNFVPIEEAKRKDFGIGEEYWLEGGSRPKERGQSQSQIQTQTQTVRDEPVAVDDEDEDNTQFIRRPRVDKPSQPERGEDGDVQIIEESARTQTSTQASRPKKRAADQSPAEKAPPPKKTTRAPRKQLESESENEDELAFPRRRGATRRR